MAKRGTMTTTNKNKSVDGDIVTAMRRTAAAPQPMPPSGTALTRPGRADKSNITGYFAIEVKDQLRRAAVDRRTTIQRILTEALNLWFAQHHLPEIASTDE